MFDNIGQPQGYGQYSPFRDQPKAPGAVPAEKPQDGGVGVAAPNVPPDPTMQGWRQPSQRRQLGQPHGQMGITDGSASPLQQAITGGPWASGMAGAADGMNSLTGVAGGGVMSQFPGGMPGGINQPGSPTTLGPGGYGALMGSMTSMPPQTSPRPQPTGPMQDINSNQPQMASQPAPLAPQFASAGAPPSNPISSTAPGLGFNTHPTTPPGITSAPPSGGSIGSGNPQADWQNFLHSQGITGAYERNNMPGLVAQFNQSTGNHFSAGNPNAKGQSDTVMVPGVGSVDVVHGGDDNNNQWMVENGQTGTPNPAGMVGAQDTTGNNNPLIAAILAQLQKRQGV